MWHSIATKCTFIFQTYFPYTPYWTCLWFCLLYLHSYTRCNCNVMVPYWQLLFAYMCQGQPNYLLGHSFWRGMASVIPSSSHWYLCRALSIRPLCPLPLVLCSSCDKFTIVSDGNALFFFFLNSLFRLLVNCQQAPTGILMYTGIQKYPELYQHLHLMGKLAFTILRYSTMLNL